MDDSKRMSGRRLVVVVESDDGLRHSLVFRLEADHYDVCAFREAWRLLADASLLAADAFILGHKVADMSGPELLARLRGAGARGGALILAGQPSAETLRQAAALKAAILSKPLLDDALSVAVQSLFLSDRGSRGGGSLSA